MLTLALIVPLLQYSLELLLVKKEKEKKKELYVMWMFARSVPEHNSWNVFSNCTH